VAGGGTGTVPDVPDEPVTSSRTLARGVLRRCGRCGAKGIFRDWFHLRERCPACGYRFTREAGAFTGVMLLNMSLTLTLMFVVLISYVGWRGITGSTLSIWPFALIALAVAVVTPIVAYPFAWSTWAAIDLATRPLDADEELEALFHRADPDQPTP
jgi:uncharacterized protein (DUF983 family)